MNHDPRRRRLIVTGEDVTTQQAGEILLRTNAWWGFAFFNREWAESVAYTVGLELHAVGQPSDETVQRMLSRFQVLPVKHMYNARIACAFMNGPRGWCDWSGRIHSTSSFTGLYPEAADIDADWRAIAHAFPYLRLDAQMLDAHGAPVNQWRIALGTARQVPPRALLAEPTEAPLLTRDMPPEAERGFEIRQLEEAVARLDVKLHGRELAEEISASTTAVLL